jgi:hypothetical protein
MGRPKPFGILKTNRSTITDAVRRIGVHAFGTFGYFRNYFNQNIYEQAQDHVLGTSAQVTANDADVRYDDAAGLFKDKTGGTVTLQDYDRVAMIVDTAEDDIDFPTGTEIVFVPYDEVDLDSNVLNLPGKYSGELRVNNGSVVITGTCYGLRIIGTAGVTTTSMSGTVFINGVPTIKSGTIDGDEVTMTEVESIKDQGSVSANGLKLKIVEIGDWDMDTNNSVAVTHGLGTGIYKKIRDISFTIRDDSDLTFYNDGYATSSGTLQLWISVIGTTQITITRLTGGFFDGSGSYNDTGYNRGWVTILYEA